LPAGCAGPSDDIFLAGEVVNIKQQLAGFEGRQAREKVFAAVNVT
jgi:hypothetical protein